MPNDTYEDTENSEAEGSEGYESHESKEYDYGDSMLKPRDILEQLKSHDKRMKDSSRSLALAKSMYMTNYWNYIRSGATTQEKSNQLKTWIDVEVNRMFPMIGSYLAALYPRANRVIVTPDPMSNGDADKAQLVANRWLASSRVHQRVTSGIRQALLYPGASVKVGYEPGRGSPIDRVWFRVVPWWETVLDRDVNDTEDERFRGHVYYQPKSVIEKKYGLHDLTGSPREDFLEGVNDDSSRTRAKADPDLPNSDKNSFVRVLEIYNLVDNYTDKNTGRTYKGRFEVYVLGQGGDVSKKPVYCGPLPISKHNGAPIPNIIPLIFNHEPEFPYRGIAHSQRMLPQYQELNSFRSFMAMASRKDSRQFAYREGAFDDDALTKITEGVDGYLAKVPRDFPGSLRDAISPIDNAPLSSNIPMYLNYIESDIARTGAQSPQARGEITKATAFEVQTVQAYTESEYGMHAALKDHWLAEIIKLFFRVLIAAMQDSGDSAGGVEGEDMLLANVGGIPSDGTGTFADAINAAIEGEIANSSARPAPFVPEAFTNLGEVGEIDESAGTGDTMVEDVDIILKDHRGNMVIVTVTDLDAEFDVSFVEGGRTPMTDAAMQQNLLTLMQPYMVLWETAVKGGPGGVLAMALMQTMAEHFNLPKDLHPAELKARTEKAMAEAGPPPTGPGQPQGPGQSQPQPGAKPGREEVLKFAKDVLSLPPDKAIAALRTAFSGDDGMGQILDEIETKPPEEQMELISEIVSGLVQASGAAEQQPAGQEQAQPQQMAEPTTPPPETSA
jgi:hypothetical protein